MRLRVGRNPPQADGSALFIDARQESFPDGNFYRFFRPASTLDGSMIIAFISSNTPVTVIPIKRNGSIRIQMNGYNINASRANGQQITNNISHSRNLIILFPLNITPFCGSVIPAF